MCKLSNSLQLHGLHVMEQLHTSLLWSNWSILEQVVPLYLVLTEKFTLTGLVTSIKFDVVSTNMEIYLGFSTQLPHVNTGLMRLIINIAQKGQIRNTTVVHASLKRLPVVQSEPHDDFRSTPDVNSDLKIIYQNRLSIYRRSYSSHIINIFIFLLPDLPFQTNFSFHSSTYRRGVKQESNFQ